MKLVEVFQPLHEANVVNPRDIDNWVENKVLRHYPEAPKDLVSWLTKRVRQHVVGLTDQQAAQMMHPVPGSDQGLDQGLDMLASQYGDWVKTAHQRGETLFHFDWTLSDFMSPLNDALAHVIDYMKSLDKVKRQPQEHEASLQAEAVRQLSKMTRLTLEQAVRHADQWFARLQAAGREHAEKADATGTKPVMNFHDGFRWVRITDPVALDREGSIMQHCVGGGSYDEEMQQGRCEIYSLRDRNNQPHVTIDVVVLGRNKDNKEIEQIKGKQNASPVQKYAPYISAFLNKSGFKVAQTGEQDLSDTMLVQKDGQWGRFQDAFEPFATVEGFALYEGPKANLYAIRGDHVFCFRRANDGKVLSPNSHQFMNEDDGLSNAEYAAIATTLTDRGYKLSSGFELRLDSRFLAFVDGEWRKVSSLPILFSTEGDYDVKVTTDDRHQRIWFEDHSGDGNSAVLILARSRSGEPIIENFFLRGDEWWSSQHRAPGLNAALAEALNHLKISGGLAQQSAIPPQEKFNRYVKFENGQWVARGY